MAVKQQQQQQSCNKQNPACRQRGIPECNLLVTQRLTKYPLLLEQLIKTSKDESQEEQEKLASALKECKCLLAELNQQLARKESFERLLDIYAHFCPKSYTIHNRHLRFTKHDLLQHKRVRQLIHSDGQLRIWSATRRKLFQVLCLILNDIIVFLRFEPCQSITDYGLLDGPTSGSASESLCFHQAPPQPSSLITHQPPAGPSAAAQPQDSQQQQQQSQSQTTQTAFRYYFANIDNKSSVISLSKLLVREKAAHDTEPRVYLISSDPRQPEMYELAFVSKRHQTGFVDKLKGSIEQHNRKLRQVDEFGELELDVDRLHYLEEGGADSDYNCDYENNNYDLEADNDDLLELNLDCECCAACSASGPPLLSDDDESAGQQLRRGLTATPLVDASRRGSPSRANCRQTKSKSLLRQRKKQQHQQLQQQNRRRDTIECELDFELDIEQDVVQPPACCEKLEAASGQQSRCQSPSDDEAGNKVVASASLVNEAAAHLEQRREHAEGPLDSPQDRSSGCSDSNKEVAGESNSSSATADSGLSERAKDSLDEAAPSKQKLRGANRRRRAQRPRQVSNQSSSSSEAAHRQAIELISVCKQLGGGQPIGQAPSVPLNNNNNNEDDDDEFDSGRGHDDSCCSSSSSCSTSGSSANSLSSESPRISSRTDRQDHLKGAAVGQQQQQQAEQQLIDFEKSADSSITSASPQATAAAVAPAAAAASQQVASPIDRPSAGQPALQRLAATNRAPCQSSSSLNPSSSYSSSSSASSTSSDSSTVGRKLECPGAAQTTGAGAAPAAAAAPRETPKSIGGGGQLIKCNSSIMGTNKSASGASCCCLSSNSKQRKLSNVSSMSGQLKLISRLKAGFSEATNLSSAGCKVAGCALKRQASSTSSAKCCSAASICHHQHQGRPAAQCDTTGGTLVSMKHIRQQMRRSLFVPEQKLEELRDLRIQLDKDKQEWQAKFNRMQEQLLNERRELDLAREKLKQDRQQVASEREQLYRKLDALKEKGILLSPSHKVIITAPEQTPNANSLNHRPLQQVPTNYGQPQPQQQVSLVGRQQPVCLRNGNNSIRIHQHQQPPQLHHLGPSGLEMMQQQQPRLLAAPANQISSTNLFIQSSASSRVPLHLSENSAPPTGGSQQQKQSASSPTLAKVATPLISVIGNSLFGVERLTGTTQRLTSDQQHPHLESHVI